MPCLNSLKGLKYDFCEPNLAGVKEVYLTDDFDALIVSAETSAMTITAISGATFYGYQMEKQQGYYTSTPTFNDNGRLQYYTNAIRVAFSKLDAEKHLEFVALTHNPVKAIVLDNNGIYHFLGFDSYLVPSEGLAQTGQNYGDENGYEIVLNAQSAYPSFIISEELAKTVIEEPGTNAQ